MFKISQEDRQKLLNYLKGRPYEEGLKPLENGKKKEEDKKDN
jgi:hypothetical protein